MSKRFMLAMIIASICELRRNLCFITDTKADEITNDNLTDIFYRVLVERQRSDYEIENSMERIEKLIEKSGYIPKP